MTSHCGCPKKPVRFFKVMDYGSFVKQRKTPMTGSHCGRRQKLTCFFKVMDYGSFENQLSIPKNFVESFEEEELRGWWTLIGPSRKEWPLKIKRIGDETCFSHLHGWPVFVRDHNIKAADILRFSYAGKSSFHVDVFDNSGCERESAHFPANSCTLPSPPICSSSLHPSSSVHDDNDDDGDSSVEIIGTTNSHARRVNSRSAPRVNYQSRLSRSRITYKGRDCEASSNRKTTPPSTYPQGNKLQNERSRPSSRGRKTKKEGPRAEYITMANNFMLENKHTGMPIIKFTMQLSHLGHSMSIPKPWAVQNLLRRDHDVKLEVVGVQQRWIVRCRWAEGDRCMFTRGWNNFLVDNNIEEHDICVLELARKGDGTYESAIVNVHIFHAHG